MKYDQSIIDNALNHVREQINSSEGDYATSPTPLKNLFTLRLALLEREEFHVCFMTNQHKIIATECLAMGTINAASVYPREIVKRALQLNAAAVVVSHNHPSGTEEASQADLALTERLTECLKLMDITLLDHILIAGGKAISFAETGKM